MRYQRLSWSRQDLMDELLLDVSHYESPTDNPEFNELLGRWLGKVAEQTKDRVGEIIETGPDLSGYSQYLEQEESKGTRAGGRTAAA